MFFGKEGTLKVTFFISWQVIIKLVFDGFIVLFKMLVLGIQHFYVMLLLSNDIFQLWNLGNSILFLYFGFIKFLLNFSIHFFYELISCFSFFFYFSFFDSLANFISFEFKLKLSDLIFIIHAFRFFLSEFFFQIVDLYILESDLCF